MLYFLLHQIKYNIKPKNLSVKIEVIDPNNNKPDSFVSKSLSKYLNIKNIILVNVLRSGIHLKSIQIHMNLYIQLCLILIRL